MSWETSLTSAETEWLSTTSGWGEVATGVQGSYCGAGTPESEVERGASPPCACAVVPACRFLSAPSSGRLWGALGGGIWTAVDPVTPNGVVRAQTRPCSVEGVLFLTASILAGGQGAGCWLHPLPVLQGARRTPVTVGEGSV
jgi:hypothetical protein